ncbi:MAG: hypothetical protein IPM12_02560 [Flavobacteriales bacterium]|nr:hypothetical protein [Flavobacteriales bacterium]
MIAVIALQSYTWLSIAASAILLLVIGLTAALWSTRQALADAQLEMNRAIALSEAQGAIASQNMRAAAKALHEIVGQSLSLAQLMARSAYAMNPDPRIKSCEESLDHAIPELQLTVRALRSGLGHEMTLGEVLALDADRLVRLERVQASMKEIGLPPTLSADERVVLYHCCQSLMGMALHRPGAEKLTITLDASGPLRLSFHLGGTGPEPGSHHEPALLDTLNKRCNLFGYTVLPDPDDQQSGWMIRALET